MKTKLLNLTLAAACGLPFAGFAQGTYLSAPDGTPDRAVVVDNDGRVGINTVSPGANLEVFGTTVLNGDVGIGNHKIYGNWEKEYYYIGHYPVAGSDGLDIHWYGGVRIGTAGGTAIQVLDNCRVGVGTTNPTESLHTTGGVYAEGGLFLKNALGAKVHFIDNGGSGFTLMNPAGYEALNIVSGRTYSGQELTPATDNAQGLGSSDYRWRYLHVGTGPSIFDGKVNCTVLELTSDRAQKGGFTPVDRRAILDQVARLPITTWHYTNEPAVRHLGPVAQDFKVAFNVGSDHKHIATVDADGVLFAALQGLKEKLEAELQSKDARIASLEKELANLRTDLASRLTALEKVMAQSNREALDEGIALTPTISRRRGRTAAAESTLRSSRHEEAHSNLEVRMTTAE